MDEDKIVERYRNYLNNQVGENLLIPDEHIEGFWTWFREKGKLFTYKEIGKVLRNPNLEIYEANSCFKNSFRILKAFRKRYFYWEGCAYNSNQYQFYKHAFNVSKDHKVVDYSLNYLKVPDINSFNNYYFGVKIPESFVRVVYNRLGDYGQHTMYSLLVPYYLYQIDYNDIYQYARL